MTASFGTGNRTIPRPTFLYAPSAREVTSAMAESVGFEPTVVLATTVFKTVPLNRSGNSPGLCPFMLLPRSRVVNCPSNLDHPI